MSKKRSGLPIPATACTAVPANACSGIVRPPTRATALLASSRMLSAPLEQRPRAVDDDGIRPAQTRGWFAQRAGGQQPAIAESTIAVDDDHLAIARQGVVLQPIVAHDHIASGTEEQLRRGGTIATDRNRHSGAPREQDGFIADHPRVVRRLDQLRTSLEEPP